MNWWGLTLGWGLLLALYLWGQWYAELPLGYLTERVSRETNGNDHPRG